MSIQMQLTGNNLKIKNHPWNNQDEGLKSQEHHTNNNKNLERSSNPSLTLDVEGNVDANESLATSVHSITECPAFTALWTRPKLSIYRRDPDRTASIYSDDET